MSSGEPGRCTKLILIDNCNIFITFTCLIKLIVDTIDNFDTGYFNVHENLTCAEIKFSTGK